MTNYCKDHRKSYVKKTAHIINGSKHKFSSVRIIGGSHKRRLVHFMPLDDLRPTPDRLRETLFNWLMADLQGACVLDAFAGSGILGFESLSRGAKRCDFVEYHHQSVQMLQSNINQLAFVNTKVYHQDVLLFLQNAPLYDIIFIDPPYRLNLWQQTLILAKKSLAPNGKLYIEANCPLEFDDNWIVLKHSKVGQVWAHLLMANK